MEKTPQETVAGQPSACCGANTSTLSLSLHIRDPFKNQYSLDLAISQANMESLLSLSFDNISSRDSSKIRKGLRQIEGLLAQICLSRAGSRSPHKRKSSALDDKKQGSTKQLGELKQDPAFREFFRLQEGFQWNGENERTLWHATDANIDQWLQGWFNPSSAYWAWATPLKQISSSSRRSICYKAY